MANELLAFWSTWMIAAAWQAALIVLLFWGAAWLASNAAPKYRFWLWQLAAAKLIVLPLWTHGYGVSLAATPPSAGRGEDRSTPHDSTADPSRSVPAAAEPRPDLEALGIVPLEAMPREDAEPGDAEIVAVAATPLDDAAPETMTSSNAAPSATPTGEGVAAPYPAPAWTAFAVWITGVFVRVSFWILQRVRLGRLLKQSQAAAPPLVSAVERTAQQMGLRRIPEVRESPDVASPMVCSAISPRLVLPSGFAERVSPEALYLVLLHELAHLARRDLAWAWAPEIAATLYWFHPAAHYVARRARLASELACDSAAIEAAGVSPRAYADALVAAVGDRPQIIKQASLFSAELEGDRP